MGTLTRRHALRAVLAAGPQLPVRPARACEFWASNLRITHPWTRETAEDATTAVISMKFGDVAEDDRPIGVQTPVASGAELSGAAAKREVDCAIPKGCESVLSQQGTFIRLLGLQYPLDAGRAYPMRLGFPRGGVVAVDLTVDDGRFY